MLTGGPLLRLNNIKIHVNIWKTEAQDESLDRISNQVSQGLIGDVNLNGVQSRCHRSKAVQCEGWLSQSWDPVAVHNSVKEEAIKCVLFTYLVLLFHFHPFPKALCFSLQRCKSRAQFHKL